MTVVLDKMNVLEEIYEFAEKESVVSLHNLHKWKYFKGVLDRMARLRDNHQRFVYNLFYINERNIQEVHRHLRIMMGIESF